MSPNLESVIGLLALGLLFAFAVRRYRRMWREWRDARAAARAPERTPTDPRVLFRDGAALHEVAIRVERVASLHLASGKIVACDPLVFASEPAFDRAVAPGDYPVDVSIAVLRNQTRVAALRVVFADGTPVRFVAAGDYGVDAGTGCFMDAQTAPLLTQALDKVDASGKYYYDEVVAPQLATRDWLDLRPAPDRPDNVVMVSSGWGDGFYTSYWGVDEHDRPLWLVTDFEVV